MRGLHKRSEEQRKENGNVFKSEYSKWFSLKIRTLAFVSGFCNLYEARLHGSSC